MHSVEDMVGASRTKKTWREALRSFRDEANRKFVDSMKDFEQVARERLKTGGKKAMVGLVGPMRMNYASSIAVLEAVLDGLNHPRTGKEET